MIAIGVGIDYALFIVTRYREFLKDGARARRRGPPVDQHGGTRGRVRRPHRRHLAARHVPHGRALRARPGRRLQRRGAPRDVGLDHAAARAPRLRRTATSTASGSPIARSASRGGRSEGVDCGTAGPARCSAARGPRSWAASSSWSCSPPRSSRCASAWPTRATSPPLTPLAAPTTCSPRGSVRASTVRCSWWPTSKAAPARRPTSLASTTRSRRCRAWRS